ncbi:peptidylprolyl isomerase [Aminivibrio sp.]|uniref:peptidylprolyl isomerase n=1 Tax=Aminivibrio sp. TaxID=1872489 RepID=UPI001A4BD3E2|nr:peptidylprolyl isomerase [Aminivibrio sp.]MBL3539629.1 peptidyl-prolyl cis-trans isomerase [Aminivibrio sp.]MDK2958336.1 peptidyl-prolyl cis-trans isomerase [Synergistaceae bacterium]
MKRRIRNAFCTLLVLLAAASAAGAAETVLAVGDEKVSAEEILYLLGLEFGGNDALAALAAKEMTDEELNGFLGRVSMALLFSRGAVLKGLHLDPRIAAQIRWNQINLLANAYIASLAPRLAFGEKELKAAYEKNRKKYVRKGSARIRHIFVTSEEKGRSALLALLSGEDFFSVAGRFSEDPASFPSGGDARWVEEGTLPASLDRLVFSVPLNTVLGPVEAGDGFCIFEVLERKEPRSLTFAEAKKLVTADLEQSVLSEEAASLAGRFPVVSSPDILGRFPVR